MCFFLLLGGRDLVFPHHENELAQSRAAAGPCGCGAVHQDLTGSHSAQGSGSTTAATERGLETFSLTDESRQQSTVGSSSSRSTGHEDRADHGDATGKGFVRYWLHNGFVNVDSEKMSKSLGNFFTIREVAMFWSC
jgi:cysteinyl-tRNA synthetase